MVPFVATERAVGVVALQATSATVATAGATADLCVAPTRAERRLREPRTISFGTTRVRRSRVPPTAPSIPRRKVASLSGANGFFRALVLSLSDTNRSPMGSSTAAPSRRGGAGRCCLSCRECWRFGSDRPELRSVGNTAQLCGGNPDLQPDIDAYDSHLDPSSDNDGCQISPGSTRSFRSASAILLALLLLGGGARAGQRHSLDGQSHTTWPEAVATRYRTPTRRRASRPDDHVALLERGLRVLGKLFVEQAAELAETRATSISAAVP
jgi:hypothetical protein